MFDTASGKPRLTFHNASKYAVHSASYSRDGSLIAAEYFQGGISVWNSKSGETVFDALDEYSPVFSSDGQSVASLRDDSVAVRDAHSGIAKAVLPAPARPKACLFTPNGDSLICLYYDDTGKVWEWETQKVRLAFEAESYDGQCLTVNPDGSRMVVADRTEQSLRVYSLDGSYLPPDDPDTRVVISRAEMLSILGNLRDCISARKVEDFHTYGLYERDEQIASINDTPIARGKLGIKAVEDCIQKVREGLTEVKFGVLHKGRTIHFTIAPMIQSETEVEMPRRFLTPWLEALGQEIAAFDKRIADSKDKPHCAICAMRFESWRHAPYCLEDCSPNNLYWLALFQLGQKDTFQSIGGNEPVTLFTMGKTIAELKETVATRDAIEAKVLRSGFHAVNTMYHLTDGDAVRVSGVDTPSASLAYWTLCGLMRQESGDHYERIIHASERPSPKLLEGMNIQGYDISATRDHGKTVFSAIPRVSSVDLPAFEITVVPGEEEAIEVNRPNGVAAVPTVPDQTALRPEVQ